MVQREHWKSRYLARLKIKFKFKADELLATPRPPFIPYETKHYEPLDRTVGDKLPSTEQPRSTSLPEQTMPTDS